MSRSIDPNDPIEVEKREMIGQKLGLGHLEFQGYGADMAREQRYWDRQVEWDRRECGAGGHDEDCEND
jgi:hypothetical protein